MVEAPNGPKLGDGISWGGLLFTVVGWAQLHFAGSYKGWKRCFDEAVVVESLDELRERMEAGELKLGSLVALKDLWAVSNAPIQNRMKRGTSVFNRVQQWTEAVDYTVGAHASLVKGNTSSRLQYATSWNLTDGVRSVAVSPHATLLDLPWDLVGAERTPLRQTPLAGVLSCLLDALLNRASAVAIFRVEHAVPVGARLSVVGELTGELPSTRFVACSRNTAGVAGKTTPLRVDDVGRVYMRKLPTSKLLSVSPARSCGQRVLVTADLEQQRRSCQTAGRWLQVVGSGMVVFGVSLVTYRAVRTFLRWRNFRRELANARQAEIEANVRAERSRAAAEGGGFAAEHDAGFAESDECTICMGRKRNAAFPCGHVCACYLCALQCDHCPICRRRGAPMRLFRT